MHLILYLCTLEKQTLNIFRLILHALINTSESKSLNCFQLQVSKEIVIGIIH